VAPAGSCWSRLEGVTARALPVRHGRSPRGFQGSPVQDLQRGGRVSREDFEEEYWGRDLSENISRLDTGREEICGELFPRHAGEIRKIDGAREVLGSLAGPKAVITNTTRGCTGEILTSHGLEGYFDVIVTSDMVEEGKPDPSMVMLAIEELGADPGDCILIGDSPSDMEAGREAGCVTVGIGVDGDCRIESIRELPGVAELVGT